MSPAATLRNVCCLQYERCPSRPAPQNSVARPSPATGQRQAWSASSSSGTAVVAGSLAATFSADLACCTGFGRGGSTACCIRNTSPLTAERDMPSRFPISARDSPDAISALMLSRSAGGCEGCHATRLYKAKRGRLDRSRPDAQAGCPLPPLA